MERLKKISIKEIATAALLIGAGILVWRAVEADSQKPKLLAKGINLELWASCTDLEQLLVPGVEGGATIKTGRKDRYAVLVHANVQTLRTDSIARGANLGGTVGVTFPEHWGISFPGVFRLGAHSSAVIANDPELIRNLTPYQPPPKDFRTDNVVIETIEGTLVCPAKVLPATVDRVAEAIEDLFNPGRPKAVITSFG